MFSSPKRPRCPTCLERSSSRLTPQGKGSRGDLLIDIFGNDWFREQHRIVNSAGDGWIYYSFTKPGDRPG